MENGRMGGTDSGMQVCNTWRSALLSRFWHVARLADVSKPSRLGLQRTELPKGKSSYVWVCLSFTLLRKHVQACSGWLPGDWVVIALALRTLGCGACLRMEAFKAPL